LFEELLFCEPKEVKSKEKDIWCGGNRGDGANRLAQSTNGQWLKDYGTRFEAAAEAGQARNVREVICKSAKFLL
jgi:hypothetical protein